MKSLLEKASVRSQAQRFTSDQYDELTRLGIIPEKTELIDGVIIGKMGKSPRHAAIKEIFAELLKSILPADFCIRCEAPLVSGYSEPEPDLAIVKGAQSDYLDSHPRHAELVVEISLTSLELDREKAAVYASMRIPDYIIVNLQNETLECYAQPADDEYSNNKILTRGQSFHWRGKEIPVGRVFIKK